MIIIGAGLAGLLAGNALQRAKIFESGPEDQLTHRAVLRFRSRAVGDAVGIDFRPVTVHKGIWLDGKFVRPSIQLANLYSRKVVGRYMDRSIWKTDAVERFIAPEDFATQLAERCAGRIEWNRKVKTIALEEPRSMEDIVSTVPMPTMVKMIGYGDDFTSTTMGANIPEFDYAGISVQRWRVPGADLFQTIYYPSPDSRLYRASMTGDLLIAEYTMSSAGDEDVSSFGSAVADSFGFAVSDLVPLDTSLQRFGKIAPVDDIWRRNFILWLTMNRRIYSLGRYATWRNILLDDVLSDISVVKRLIAGGVYHAAKIA